jgi:hypothetical protein
MGFSRANRDSPSNKVRTARYMRGKCGICFKMIMPGEKYLLIDGSITSNVRPAHLDCYHKPAGRL